jgi:transcriptional regulator with XRE-family HTH domain
MPTPHYPSSASRRALHKLGADLRDARRRRRLTMALVADRAFTSRSTLQRVEEGDPSVGMGIYAAVLHALGLLDGLAQLAEPTKDSVGMALASESLPKRVRLKTRRGQP